MDKDKAKYTLKGWLFMATLFIWWSICQAIIHVYYPMTTEQDVREITEQHIEYLCDDAH